ncbi:MAG: hypothetical protein NC429_14900 [Lachnospiraceae bacterium]|nr:hypothetical protein [Lachnospiraceae bacterium]
MKRNWILTAGLCTFLAVSVIGCGAGGGTGQAVTAERTEISDNEQERDEQKDSRQKDSGQENSKQEDSGQEGSEQEQETPSPENETKTEIRELEILDGTVKSIGDEGLVIIKTRIEETDEGVSLAIAPAEGHEAEEDLVDVSFAENVNYELHTVKNGGVNPDEDVSIKGASFSDIKREASLILEGYYEGSAFIAEKVVIYEFV